MKCNRRKAQKKARIIFKHTVFLFLSTIVFLPCLIFANTNITKMTLRNGEKQTVTFTQDDTKNGVLLWLKGRIILSEGEQEGDYALELTLNGTKLTLKNVQVLNKQTVYDKPGSVGDDPKHQGRKIISPPSPIEIFNPETGRWYLKADTDEFPFNATGNPGDPYTSILGGALPAKIQEPNLNSQLMQCLSALRSHYYEYLFQVPNYLIKKQNTLTIDISLSEQFKEKTVEVSFGTIVPKSGTVIYQRPIEEFVIVQQAPSLPDIIDEKDGIKIAGCAGEFEPVTLALFALNSLENITVSIEPLVSASEGKPILVSAAQCYYFAQRAAHQQSGARLPFTLGIGPDGVAPDVLIRMEEKPAGIGNPVPIPYNWYTDRQDPKKFENAIATSRLLEQTPGIPVKSGTSQRFLIDLKIPENQDPGIYTGTLLIKSSNKVVQRIPLILTVYPFKLLQPRQRYWMHRMYYAPITHPTSVQAIKMIGDMGMYGICQLRGVGVSMTMDKKTGEIVIYDTQLQDARIVLRNANLAPCYATDLVSVPFSLICEQKYGIRPGSAQWFGYRLMPELLDSPLDVKGFKPGPRDPNDEQTAKLKDQLPQIKKDVVELLKRIKSLYDKNGLDVWHFAYDEPDGTAWVHPWVKFSNEIAHDAGFKTWSTHNDPLGWPSGIDMSVAAWPAIVPYAPNQIHTEHFQGKMGYRGIPIMGQFKGRMDEICIYNRPLTDEEILSQHIKPSEKGLLAYYPLDEEKGTHIKNLAGDTSFDLTISGGKYARWVDGVKGKALEFEYPNTGDGNIDAKTGNPTPTPVSISPSNDVLKGKVQIPGDGWAISFWYSGRRSSSVFEMPDNTLRFSGTKAELRTNVPGTDTQSRIIIPAERQLPPDDKFWNHITISVDEKKGIIKYYMQNDDQRNWYKKNIKWCYNQFRGFNPMFCRLFAGNLTWHLKDLEHMTIFVFDLNYGIANLAWPEGGDRYCNSSRWYPELGLLNVREGVDDARYANTLYELLKTRKGEQSAWNEVAQLYPGKEIYQERVFLQPIMEGVSYNDIRRRLVERILDLSKEQK